jgi:hypothetical protein
MDKWTDKIPSFLWIPIIVAAIALLIGGVMAFFFGLSYVEGFGSLLILALGWIGFRSGNNTPSADVGSIGIAVGITFFALMGLALDQTGNFIYNQPMEWIFCPENTELARETIQRGARGGGVSMSQNFTCASSNNGEILRKITVFEHLAYRFIQYVVLGYILLYASRIYGKIKTSRKG